MNILQRSVELINPPKYEILLSNVEQAARNCYRSQDKITDNSAEPMIRALIKSGHEGTIEFANLEFMIVCDRAISHQIVRHRIGTSYCISGDSIIPSYNSDKKRTIADLYKYYITPRNRGALKGTIIRGIDESGLIIPQKISKVFYNGKQEVYKLTTESGRSIKATISHKFFTDCGWVELKDLHINDLIYVNGKNLLDNEDWIRYNYLTLNKTRKEVAKLANCCEATLYKAFRKFNIVKPHSNYPNRVAGHGVKGMFSKEERKNISKRMLGKNNPSYKNNRDDITMSSAYSEANRKYKNMRNKCEFCGVANNIEIHHIDKNPRNNDLSNIKFLCTKCHHLWHFPYAKGMFLDKIVSIERVGLEDVYDLEIDGDNHNYVANGIIVHNCQESMRYCSYNKDVFNNSVNFIVPHDMNNELYETWRASCLAAEAAYFVLLEKGAKPETARSVLPQCTATHLVMQMNMRALRHFLKLRLDSHAQSDIRDIAYKMLELVYEKYPVFVEDIYEQYRRDK